jgi:hypothetical protein
LELPRNAAAGLMVGMFKTIGDMLINGYAESQNEIAIENKQYIETAEREHTKS